MNKNSIRNLLAGASLAVVGLTGAAYAQDGGSTAPAARNDGDDVENIVVTARRSEELLQDVPISITVYNQAELSQRNVVNAQDLALSTPSVSANSNFGSENSSFAIRGFVQDIGTQPSVGVYFNDVVAPRGFSNGIVVGDGAGPGTLWDLQNVQVLKGPQGTLFGRNTTGGAILLVPQRPTDAFEGYLQGTVGNYDLRREQAVVNIPLGDQAALRLGIDHQQRDGYMNNTSGIGPRDFDDLNYTAYRAGFRVNLTPTLENYTLVNYSDSDTHGSAQKMVGAGTVGLFAALGPLGTAQFATQGPDFFDFEQDIPNPRSHLTVWQATNTTTWNLSDNLTFKNIASYGELLQDLTNPIFGTNLHTAGGDPISFAITAPVNHTANESTITEEARFEGSNFDNRLTWQGGVYFERSDPRGIVGSFSPTQAHCDALGGVSTSNGSIANNAFANAALASCNAPLGAGTGVVNVTTGQTSAQTTGIYSQGTFAITDQLKLTLGYRYTWDRIKDHANQFTNFLDGPPPAGGPTGFVCTNTAALPPDCGATYSVKTDAPTWLIDLDYTPIDDLLLYAKYSRGYRSGTISPNVVDPFTSAGSERVDTYEIGEKYSFHAGGLRGIFNASLFFNDFQNQQLQIGFVRFDIPAAPTAAPLNIGASQIYGAELQASIMPVTGLTLSADYTYLHTEVKDAGTVPGGGVAGPYFVINTFQAGDELVLTPHNKYTISADYRLPLDDSVGRVNLGVDFIHTDKALASASDAANPALASFSHLAATNILNANVSWTSMFGSSVDLSVFGTNVTDEHYISYVSGIGLVAGFETGQLGPPRMYGASLTYHFGG